MNLDRDGAPELEAELALPMSLQHLLRGLGDLDLLRCKEQLEDGLGQKSD